MPKPVLPCFFLEKTLVKGRLDREAGLHSLGRALWSPQRDDNGADIYKQMREVRPGDIVFHLIDNKEVCGYSKVDSKFSDDFVGLDGTDWARKKCYRVSLRGFTEISPKIQREWILEDVQFRNVLQSMLKPQAGLFFNKDFNLRQGAYLTSVTPELFYVLNEAYRKHADGRHINDAWILPTPTVIQLFKMLTDFATASDASGFTFNKSFVHRFLAALIAKRFLILSGLSGSGKTKLAQAFAEYLCKDPPNQARVIPVGADWTSNEILLGYPNGLNPRDYVTQPVLDLMLEAGREGNANKPYVLILDEMNLSHVERYFADFLSALESGQPIPLYEGPERMANAQPLPSRLPIPSNLFVLGTINVDETTYMFSPKVLDRAGVIEFRVTENDVESLLNRSQPPELKHLTGKGREFADSFIKAAHDMAIEVPDQIQAVFRREIRLFQAHRTEFGFRVIHEAARFMNAYNLLGGYDPDNDEWFPSAMDAVIVQKMLPKLHGTRAKLEPLLWSLAWACGASRDDQYAAFVAQCLEAGKAEDVKYDPSTLEAKVGTRIYPLSFEKVLRMWHRLVTDQFVTFSEA